MYSIQYDKVTTVQSKDQGPVSQKILSPLVILSMEKHNGYHGD